MHIIKLNAIDSTNSYLRRLSAQERLEDFTIVTAKLQTEGRGQMGTIWNSEIEKNLTVSVYKDLGRFNIENNFDISMVVSLAIINSLKHYNLKRLRIKWPNDILSDNKKIGGILIENIIKRNRLSASIIGIGLNTNQTSFKNLPKASSLRLLTGRIYDIDELLYFISTNLQYYFNKLREGKIEDIKNEYEDYLFRKHKPSTFQDNKGELFSGYIKGVSEHGKLILLLEDEKIKEFDFKELTLKY